MRIIQQGQDPATKPLRATCSNCRTVFEFTPQEAKFTHDQRDGDFYSIGCPHCGHQVTKSKPGYFDPYS